MDLAQLQIAADSQEASQDKDRLYDLDDDLIKFVV